MINGAINPVDLIDIARVNGTLENTIFLTALSVSNVDYCFRITFKVADRLMN